MALKIAVINRKIDCLQARTCIIQPGNFTGWGSEGVNVARLLGVSAVISVPDNGITSSFHCRLDILLGWRPQPLCLCVIHNGSILQRPAFQSRCIA